MPFWQLLIALIAGIGLAASPAWKGLRHVITLAHEGAHAVVGILTGRRLNGIKLHTDTSGATTTSGVGWGLSGMLTTFAGYPGPAAVAGLIVTAVAFGRASLAAGAIAVVLLVLLLFTRNAWGLLVTALGIAFFVAALWFLPPWLTQYAVLVVAGVLLGGSFRTLIEERVSRKHGDAQTDIAVLGQRTNIPASAWWVLALLVSTAWVAVPLYFTWQAR